MQDAVPVGKGAMAAILGLNFEMVQSLTNLAQAQASGICQAANDNDPSQVVISGEKYAVELAISLAKEEGAKRAIMLPVSAPFHCELMAPAAEQMKIKLDSIKIDRDLLLETFVPSKELTLNGSFLLYDANAKQSPSKEYIAHP